VLFLDPVEVFAGINSMPAAEAGTKRTGKLLLSGAHQDKRNGPMAGACFASCGEDPASASPDNVLSTLKNKNNEQ